MPKLEEVLYSGQIGEGETVKQFESEFGRYIGNPNTLSFSSGTAALHTALILAGVKPGDEVLSTPMTAEPTNMAVMHAGAKPVWADIDPESGNIAADSIAEKIGPKTKAIIAVHYAGVPAAIGRIREVAARHGVPVIEDAAHAWERCTRGSVLETIPNMSCFQAIKHLTTVDGGMIVCKDPADLPRWPACPLVRYRSAQSRTSVDVKEVGYKYHMNNVTAAIGLAQLSVIQPRWTGTSKTALYYDQALTNIPGLRTRRARSDCQTGALDVHGPGGSRDDLAKHLTDAGVECLQAHRRNDEHSVFPASRSHLPGLDSFYSRMLHIPCGWWVTDEQREYVVDCLRRGW
jgi:dTDP-4-amino-4,6-dideoxygalactose transaminase